MIIRQILLWGVIAATTGCAASSTFTAYPRKVQPLITSLSTRAPLDLNQTLQSEAAGKDRILYTMERGRYAQVTGNSDVSMGDFAASMERIKENDEKALVSASDIGANVAAALVNDNAIPYEGEGYERVLLHHYQALNYLQKKDLEGAGVEVRRANAEQNDALQRFEKELEKSRETAERKNVDANGSSAIDTQYAQMDEVAGRVKNSFQNAYTFYLSGFIYELLQQPNDAYIDYKKALEIYPENRYLQKDVLRLAAKLDMSDDLAALKKRFPVGRSRKFSHEGGKDSGELLVLFEDGFVPQKHEVKINLPIEKSIIPLAFPVYREKWSEPSPLRVLNGSELVGTTESICDVRALAVKSLKERVPVLATRQIIRAVAKAVTAAQARKNMGEFGSLAASVWNVVSESADLRSWLTLPANAQIMRVHLPPGSYRLTLQHPMALASSQVDVEIATGGTTVVQAVRSGQQMYRSVTQF